MSLNLCSFLVLFCLFYQGECLIRDILKKDFFMIYMHITFELHKIISGKVTKNQITYYLFTRENPNNYTEIEPYHQDALNNTNVTIVFLIHGWTGNRHVQWYEDLKNAFLARQDEEFYVLQVDWARPADQFYPTAAFNTKAVGEHIGNFLVGAHRKYSIPLTKFLLVGHSLGGQIAGFVGKKVIARKKEKLGRIVALDPAGPFFDSRPEKDRLNRYDAKVVEVVHTNGGTFGFRTSCGTIDFYPNGGYRQPGCAVFQIFNIASVTDLLACDHARSWAYYIEALLDPTSMVASQCTRGILNILHCNNKVQVSMGDLRTTLRGNFYFNTNGAKPFARDSKKIYSASIFDSISKLPIPGLAVISNVASKAFSIISGS